ncbi:Sulfotransferase domain [Trinorchestia longiramus]|nr:Sulfotransferase domain [Trinorchestia longiramus]
MTLPTGHKIIELTSRQDEIQKLFTGRITGSHTLQPGGWFFPTGQRKACLLVKNFEFYEDDVVVMTMPKSGTTWTQEIVWTLVKNHNFDNPTASNPLIKRSPIIGCVASIVSEGLAKPEVPCNRIQEYDKNTYKNACLDCARTADRPRILKTHLSFPFLSETALTKGKIVYTIRDPRDVCISYHHHSKLFKYEGYIGSFDQYVDAFLEGCVVYGPYWSHVKAAWDRRSCPNLYIMYYEKMKRNPNIEFTKLSKFLGLELNEEEIDKVVRHTSFLEMKKRDDHVLDKSEAIFLDQAYGETKGGFFRSGMSGEWKTVLTSEQKHKFEIWIEKNCPDKEIMENILHP